MDDPELISAICLSMFPLEEHAAVYALLLELATTDQAMTHSAFISTLDSSATDPDSVKDFLTQIGFTIDSGGITADTHVRAQLRAALAHLDDASDASDASDDDTADKDETEQDVYALQQRYATFEDLQREALDTYELELEEEDEVEDLEEEEEEESGSMSQGQLDEYLETFCREHLAPSAARASPPSRPSRRAVPVSATRVQKVVALLTQTPPPRAWCEVEKQVKLGVKPGTEVGEHMIHPEWVEVAMQLPAELLQRRVFVSVDEDTTELLDVLVGIHLPLHGGEVVIRVTSFRNWDREFGRLVTRPANSPMDVAQRNTQMHDLVADFTERAESVAETIVREMHLPEDQRQYPPAKLGGVAGGEKVVYGNVLFKVSRELDVGLFGSDERAAKAASNELRGLNAVLQADVPLLKPTLSAMFVVDGHAIVATAWAPLKGNQTLEFGSSDGGRTVHSSPRLRTKFAQLARFLYLKEHVIVDAEGVEHVMPLAGDVEGHWTDDGAYICDLGRLAPPMPPRGPAFRGDHLYRLFRFEYLQKHATCPLSADAFSGWGRHNMQEHNAEARSAYQRLLTVVVPLVASKLDDAGGSISASQLRDLMHNDGVNMRLSGAVFAACANDDAKRLLITDMVTRCTKVLVRLAQRLRLDYRGLTTIIQGDSPATEAFWIVLLPALAAEKFGLHDPDALALLRRDGFAVDVDALAQTKRKAMVPPKYANVEDGEQRLLESLRNREESQGPDAPSIGPILSQLLKVYTIQLIEGHGSEDWNATFAKACAVGDRMVRLSEGYSYHHFVLLEVGNFKMQCGDHVGAAELLQRCVAERRSVFGERSESVAEALTCLATTYEPREMHHDKLRLLQEALEMHPPSSKEAALIKHNMAISLSKLSRHQEALVLLLESLADLEDEVHKLQCKRTLAQAYSELGQYQKQKEILEECLPAIRRLHGEGSTQEAAALNGLGVAYGSCGDFHAQMRLTLQSLALHEKAFGRHSPRLQAVLQNLARTQTRLGDPQAAIATLQRAVAVNPNPAVQRDLGKAHMEANNIDAAIELLSQALSGFESALGREHLDTAECIEWLGMSYGALQMRELAIELIEEAVGIKERLLGNEHPNVSIARLNLANECGYVGQLDRKRELITSALEHIENPPSRGTALANLGVCCAQMGRYAEAKTHLTAAYTIFVSAFGPNHPNAQFCAGNLAKVNELLGE